LLTFDRNTCAVNDVLLSGPTLAAQPILTDTWWTNWLFQIAGNGTIPDQYAWHIEGSVADVNDDLQTNNESLAAMLAAAGLDQPKQVNINEYDTFDEQIAAGAAWWIARLERYDAIGLRGN
jgi:hypothetical protein